LAFLTVSSSAFAEPSPCDCRVTIASKDMTAMQREANQAGSVRNVKAAMMDGLIVVTYDLQALDAVPVSLTVSDDDGRVYTLDMGHVTGDVGDDVTPGENRRIIWSVKNDYPLNAKKELKLDVSVCQR
jgi:hypothetical protein